MIENNFQVNYLTDNDRLINTSENVLNLLKGFKHEIGEVYYLVFLYLIDCNNIYF